MNDQADARPSLASALEQGDLESRRALDEAGWRSFAPGWSGELASLRRRLADALELLARVRDHAGVDCTFGDLPEAVAALRRKAWLQQ